MDLLVKLRRRIIKAHRGHSHRSITGIYHHASLSYPALLTFIIYRSIKRRFTERHESCGRWLKRTHFISGRFPFMVNQTHDVLSQRNGKEMLSVSIDRPRDPDQISVSGFVLFIGWHAQRVNIYQLGQFVDMRRRKLRSDWIINRMRGADT